MTAAKKCDQYGLILRKGTDTKALPQTAMDALNKERLQRFVGVSYVKATERWSHYTHCEAAGQYDAILHLDVTSALQPLTSAPAEKSVRPGTVDYRYASLVYFLTRVGMYVHVHVYYPFCKV